MDPPVSNESDPPGHEADLRQWVERSQQGSEEAFARLVATFAGRLQSLIYRMLLDWDEARDVAQETFIHVFHALPRYEHRGRFQSWLFQIGARKAIDALRQRKRRAEYPPGGEAKEAPTVEEAGAMDPAVARNELAAAIEQAVRELPPEQRTAFVLAEYEGYDHQQIAAVLGGSAKRVEMHLYRARLALRDRLQGFL